MLCWAGAAAEGNMEAGGHRLPAKTKVFIKSATCSLTFVSHTPNDFSALIDNWDKKYFGNRFAAEMTIF